MSIRDDIIRTYVDQFEGNDRYVAHQRIEMLLDELIDQVRKEEPNCCGAPNARTNEDRKYTDGACHHEACWYDRTICPEPCGMQHSYCTDCGDRFEPCRFAGDPLGIDGRKGQIEELNAATGT